MSSARPGGGASARELLAVAAAAVAILAIATWPWALSLHRELPNVATEKFPGWGADDRLVAWILSWDVHALLTAPSRLFDANVYHPGRDMLARSEHLLSYLLVFAPPYLATGNPVLAINLTTIATYVAAPVVGYALLRRLGLGAAAAAVGAGALAVGPQRVPLHPHVIQYSSFFLPLVLLAAIRVEERAAPARLAALFAATLVAAFASYYVAALTAMLLAIEIALALGFAGLRAAAAVAAASGAAFLCLLAASRPYFGVAREIAAPAPPPLEQLGAFWRSVSATVFSGDHMAWGGVGVAPLAVLGLASVLRRERRRAWVRWVAIAAVGTAFVLGPATQIAGVAVPLPGYFVGGTILRFFRMVPRFFLLAHVGIAGLAAEGAQLLLLPLRGRGRGAAAARLAVAAALVAAVLLPRAAALGSARRDAIPTAAEQPPAYRWLAAHGDGPLLVVPPPGRPLQSLTSLRQAEAMLASTHHWLPLLNGYTGVKPFWVEAMTAHYEALPDPHALQQVVDLTGLRYVLVPREGVPPDVHERWAAAADGGTLRRRSEGDPDLLLEVLLRPRRDWSEVMASRSAAPGETMTGTPLQPLSAAAARGTVRLLRPPPRQRAGGEVPLALEVENRGDRDWPALVPPTSSPGGLVVVRAAWRAAGSGAVVADSTLRLPHDLIAGDRVRFSAAAATPEAPGRYRLELRLEQLGGTAFTATGEPMDAVEVDVIAASRPQPPGGASTGSAPSAGLGGAGAPSRSRQRRASRPFSSRPSA